MELGNIYLLNILKQFVYYKLLAEKAISQIEQEKIFYAFNEDTNSIAIIMNHIAGNLQSRFTEFLTSDGEKPWRDRDSEFETPQMDFEELMEKWGKAWQHLFDTLNSLSKQDINKIIYIRNEGHTVVEALNRQLAHYPYHIGQIIYAAKILKGGDWQSLSVPKNSSKQFNEEKFSKEKSIKNFTDDAIKELNK